MGDEVICYWQHHSNESKNWCLKLYCVHSVKFQNFCVYIPGVLTSGIICVVHGIMMCSEGLCLVYFGLPEMTLSYGSAFKLLHYWIISEAKAKLATAVHRLLRYTICSWLQASLTVPTVKSLPSTYSHFYIYKHIPTDPKWNCGSSCTYICIILANIMVCICICSFAQLLSASTCMFYWLYFLVALFAS